MDKSRIKEHMDVIGADGVHVGTVDRVDGDRIKLAKSDGAHGQVSTHRQLPLDLVADVEDDTVRLGANADAAILIMREMEGQ